MKYIRSPIIVVMGHVDHGKTTLLDSIRNTRVALKESGRITQMVGASYVPNSIIKELGKDLTKKMGIDLIIPGLLFVDTPGHEAFTSLRERGGSIADLTILVVDINEGFKPQTVESIRILKENKVPFVIAANKIDLIDGWKSQNTYSLFESLSNQRENVKQRLDEKIYSLIGELSYYNLTGERFDRIQDFTKEVAIIPISAKSKEGLAELLILISGLSQKYLKDRLYITQEKAKGTILELKDVKGMGNVIDVILYDGILHVGDKILFPTIEGIKETKIRSLFQAKGDGYEHKKSISAAAGIRIFAPNLDKAIPGSPFGVKGGIDRKELEKHIHILTNELDEGVVVKADSLGSLEALKKLLNEKNINISKMGIGTITNDDLLFARNTKTKVILAFNIPIKKEILSNQDVKIIWNNVIYKIVEMYEEYTKELEERKKKMIEKIGSPVKIKVLEGYFFRISKPAIFGIKILEGKLQDNTILMNKEGKILGSIKGIQKDGTNIKIAEQGDEVAISMDKIILGKDINANDILYSYLNNEILNQFEDSNLVKEIKRILIKKKIKDI